MATLLEEVQERVPAAIAGGIQGGTFNFADDFIRLIGSDADVEELITKHQREHPLTYGLANTAGNFATNAGILSRAATVHWLNKLPKGPAYLAGSTGVDAALGGLYGLGGPHGDGKERTPREILMDVGMGAGIAAATAGALPVAAHNIENVRRAFPALRTGGRKPPLNARQQLALRATPTKTVDEAMARDTQAARGRGAPAFAPFGGGPMSGAQMRAIDTGGDETRALFDVAAREPGARKIFDNMVANAERTDLVGAINSARKVPPKGQTTGDPLPKAKQAREALAGIDKDKRADLLKALDDEGAHAEWLKEARALFKGKPDEAAAFASQIVGRIRASATKADAAGLQALRARLTSGGDLAEKLSALRVTVGPQQTARTLKPGLGQRERMEFKAHEDRRAAKAPAQRSVGRGERARWRERRKSGDAQPSEFANLQPKQAQALMRQLLKNRRVGYTRPSTGRDALMDVQALPGIVPWKPFEVDPLTGELGYYAGKVLAPAVEQYRAAGHR